MTTIDMNTYLTCFNMTEDEAERFERLVCQDTLAFLCRAPRDIKADKIRFILLLNVVTAIIRLLPELKQSLAKEKLRVMEEEIAAAFYKAFFSDTLTTAPAIRAMAEICASVAPPVPFQLNLFEETP